MNEIFIGNSHAGGVKLASGLCQDDLVLISYNMTYLKFFTYCRMTLNRLERTFLLNLPEKISFGVPKSSLQSFWILVKWTLI